jgi:YbbR domain-containing protein
MSWGLITEDWRIKLLALGLAVLMLGAVAFSQNPPTTRTITVPLHYMPPPSNVVLINYPARVPVTFNGLAEVIAQVNLSNLTAVVDTAGVRPGNPVMLKVHASTSVQGGVTIQPTPPIAVEVDTLQTQALTVTVPTATAAGWQVLKAEAQCPLSPCVVHFTGPVSLETNLTASVPFPGTIGPTNCPGLTCSINVLAQPVLLRNASGLLDIFSLRTFPQSSLDVTTADLSVEAKQGATSSTVPIVVTDPIHYPPQGSCITAVSVTPATVVITGDAAAVGRVQRITMPGPDLSKSTSDATFQIQIPYPRDTTGSVALATVVYSISHCPVPSPSPNP